MELLRTTRSQLAPLLQSLSPAVRVMAAIALLFALGIGVYYYNQRAPAANVCLFGGRELAATEIAAVETALGKAGQNAYEVEGNRILVPQDQRAAILRAIDEAGATPKSVVGYDSQQTTLSPFSTGQQQRNQDKAKKQEKICAMIREIQGIEYVLVEYDETRSEGFPRTTQRTAAVTARPAGGRHLEPFEIKTIRATVQRAVAGLQPEDIVVIDGNSGIAHDWQDQESGAGTLKDYATAKQYHEAAWKQEVQSVLKCYPGVRVDVHIEFDHRARANPAAWVADGQQTSAAQYTNTLAYANADRAADSAASSGSGPGGATPGSNGQARIEESTFSLQKPAVSREMLDTSSPPGALHDYIPASASVSIGVPTHCVRRLATLRISDQVRGAQEPPADQARSIPALSPSQINKCFEQIKADIIHRVRPLLGRQQSSDVSQYIAVSLDPEVETVAEVPATSDNDDLNYFAQFKFNWYAWLIPVVFVAGVILVRIGNRTHLLPVLDDLDPLAAQFATSPPTEPHDSSSAFNEILHNDLEPTEKELRLATDIDRAFESDYQTSLSSELVEVVENDPRATMSVFRSWLTEAA